MQGRLAVVQCNQNINIEVAIIQNDDGNDDLLYNTG